MIVAPEPVSRLVSDDARAVVDRLFGLGLLRGWVVLGVHDREVLTVDEAGCLEVLGEVPPVVFLPAVRRLGVGEEHPDAAPVPGRAFCAGRFGRAVVAVVAARRPISRPSAASSAIQLKLFRLLAMFTPRNVMPLGPTAADAPRAVRLRRERIDSKCAGQEQCVTTQ